MTTFSKPLIGITMDKEGEHVKMRHAYADAVEATGGLPVFLSPARDASNFAVRIDGLLIPGGDDLDPAYYGEQMLPKVRLVQRERSDFEIALLRSVTELHKPVLGICYGMQLLNVFYGGTLYQDIETQLKVEIDHKTGYHIIVITENRFLQAGTFSVNSTHHQAIKILGNGLSAFGHSPDNLIEAFLKEGYPFLVGIQWHPERDMENSVSAQIFEKFIGAAG
ncbi:MAG: gamma-glutamyl-gamma-aminobutyrate hydrolase family protein [Nitrospirota bacterium]